MSEVFRYGDKVKYVDGMGMTAYGEVTLVRGYDGKVKVIFDGKYDLNYDYYAPQHLERVTEEEYNAQKG